jgi:hypothetical protein
LQEVFGEKAKDEGESMANGRQLMMIKCVASLALAIIILASLALPASAQDNPVDLKLGGEGATRWNITNIEPGDSGTKTVTLHNAGLRNGFVTMWISDIVSSEGINPESETDTAEPGELEQYLLLNISCSLLDSNISLPTTIDKLPHSASDPDYIKISPLNVGDTIILDWQWRLPAETSNEVQGDSLSFTVNYMLEEFPPTTLAGWWLPPPPSPPAPAPSPPSPSPSPPSPPPSPSPPAPPSPSPPSTEGEEMVTGAVAPIWPLVGGIIAGVVVVGLLTFFLIRRRAQLTRR